MTQRAVTSSNEVEMGKIDTLCSVIGIFALTFFLMINFNKRESPPLVKPGIDVLLEKRLDLIRGKRVGLITNPTGITSDFRPTIDALFACKETRLVALFGPEHGIRGDVPGGEPIASYVDRKTGLPVHSLYGRTRKPTPDMLKGLDVLIFDIQDIGIRPYTYIYTMALAMEAAREQGLPFIVLDRPNPLGGHRVEGKILEPRFESFIGMYPIPYVYGMTVGELARLFNEEFGIGVDLTVVPMEGWRRGMLFEETGLLWVPTSPHVPYAHTVFLIAATGGLGELSVLSEGVGTPMPFELVGAPWIDGEKLAAELNRRNLPGVYFRATHFRPFYFRFAETPCQGVQIHILDARAFEPMRVQIHILAAIRRLFPDHPLFDVRANPKGIRNFDRAMGSDSIRRQLEAGWEAEKIIRSWEPELEKFRQIRRKYLLYPE